jgi:hypothetical protein
MDVMSTSRARTETRSERHARQARAAVVDVAERQRQRTAARLRLRAARRRRAWIALGSAVALAAVVALLGALVASRADDPSVEWWFGVGWRYSHGAGSTVVPVDQAAVFAAKVMALPAALVALTIVLLHVPGVRDRFAVPAPMWVGLVLAPGLGAGVLLSYAASVLGQGDDDFLPALAGLAPEGLPMLAFFTVFPALAWRDARRRRRGAVRPGEGRPADGDAA